MSTRPRGDEVHRDRQRRPGHAAVEVPGHLQVGRELGVLEMPDARTGDAGVGQLVVEPRRGAVAEVRAERGVQRAQDLQQDEQDADHAERNGQRARVMLDRADKDAGGDGEPGRQQPAQRQQRPPADRHRPVRTPERGRELQLLPGAQPPQPRQYCISRHESSRHRYRPRSGHVSASCPVMRFRVPARCDSGLDLSAQNSTQHGIRPESRRSGRRSTAPGHRH